MLNPPIYDEYIPAYLNYASLGPIIASLLIKMLQEAYLNKELIRDSDHRAWMIKLSRAQLPDLDCVKDRFNNYPRSASQYVSPVSYKFYLLICRDFGKKYRTTGSSQLANSATE